MKFYQSKVLQNLSKFRTCPSMDEYPGSGLMRYPADMFLIHKVCEYWKPKQVLEIGFFSGQTFGLIVDACDSNGYFTAVDIRYAPKKIFDNLYKDQSNMTFLEIDSKNLNLQPQTYDLICVDGDHSYEYATIDIKTSLDAIKTDGIICVDDYHMAGVWQAINENLTGQSDWVPFLMGPQSMFFHHTSHEADEFLDVWIQQTARDCVKFVTYNLAFDEKIFNILNCGINYENIDDLITRMTYYNW